MKSEESVEDSDRKQMHTNESVIDLKGKTQRSNSKQNTIRSLKNIDPGQQSL